MLMAYKEPLQSAYLDPAPKRLSDQLVSLVGFCMEAPALRVDWVVVTGDLGLGDCLGDLGVEGSPWSSSPSPGGVGSDGAAATSPAPTGCLVPAGSGLPVLSVSTCAGLLRSSNASKARRFASADNCLTAGGGGLVFVGGDRERTGRALGGGFVGGGEADDESTDTAGGGAL